MLFEESHALLRHVDVKGELFALSLKLRQASQHILKVIDLDITGIPVQLAVSNRLGLPSKSSVLLHKLSKVGHESIDRVLHMQVSHSDPDFVLFRQYGLPLFLLSNRVLVLITAC